MSVALLGRTMSLILSNFRRVVQYPAELELKDYMRWRQVDSKLTLWTFYFVMLTGRRSAHQQHVQHMLLDARPGGRHDGARGAQGAQCESCALGCRFKLNAHPGRT